eukprot:1318189-Amorphochlora_amoeboformis.AAC.2
MHPFAYVRIFTRHQFHFPYPDEGKWQANEIDYEQMAKMASSTHLNSENFQYSGPNAGATGVSERRYVSSLCGVCHFLSSPLCLGVWFGVVCGLAWCVVWRGVCVGISKLRVCL